MIFSDNSLDDFSDDSSDDSADNFYDNLFDKITGNYVSKFPFCTSTTSSLAYLN